MRKTEEAAQLFAEHLAALRFVEAFSMLAEDGKYIVIGTTPASGIYDGRQDLLDRLLPKLASFKAPPKLSFSDPVVQNDRAVILGAGSGEGPTGPYEQPYYAFVTRVRGDEFVEIIEFMDTQMLMSALFGAKPNS